MNDIVWQDPPPARRGTGADRTGTGRRQRFVLALQQNPGVWAVYPEPRTYSAARNFERDFPGCEAVTRKREDGDCDIYVRWVGAE